MTNSSLPLPGNVKVDVISFLVLHGDVGSGKRLWRNNREYRALARQQQRRGRKWRETWLGLGLRNIRPLFPWHVLSLRTSWELIKNAAGFFCFIIFTFHFILREGSLSVLFTIVYTISEHHSISGTMLRWQANDCCSPFNSTAYIGSSKLSLTLQWPPNQKKWLLKHDFEFFPQ